MMPHPPFSQISRFADGDVHGVRRVWLARHLAGCTRCRAALATIHDTTAEARRVPVPVPPDDALERILARRRGGDRVILPMADPRPAPSPGRRAARVAAAILVLLTSGVALRAAQGWGTLHIAPARPARGDLLALAYQDASRFAGAERLSLLASYRTADDSAVARPPVVVGQLSSDGSGTFRGTVRLPTDVVYATFSVTSGPGDVAVRAAQPRWDVLTHAAGRPEAAALAQQRIELIGRLPSLNR